MASLARKFARRASWGQGAVTGDGEFLCTRNLMKNMYVDFHTFNIVIETSKAMARTYLQIIYYTRNTT